MFDPPKIEKKAAPTPKPAEMSQQTLSQPRMTEDVPPSVGPAEIGVREGRFVEKYFYVPEHPDLITLLDVVELLMALGITMDPAVFQKLPERIKRQFLCLNRAGKMDRYDSREYNMTKHLEK